MIFLSTIIYRVETIYNFIYSYAINFTLDLMSKFFVTLEIEIRIQHQMTNIGDISVGMYPTTSFCT